MEQSNSSHLTKHERIWQTVKLIPEGKVATYGQIADLAGLPNRARLAGTALRNTPKDLILPWHRVIRADGKLAFTPSSSQAMEQRARLLDEGVEVINFRVRMERFQWTPELNDLLYRVPF